VDEDVDMLLPDAPSDAPSYMAYPAHSPSNLSQLTSFPRTSAVATSSHPADSDDLEVTHSPAIDIDARSDISMPPLYDASDSESEEDHPRYYGHDSMSESDADAYDVEMALLANDGDLSDDDDALSSEGAPPTSIPSVVDNNTHHRRVVIEEVEDQDERQQRTGEWAALQPSINGKY
jgi:hypothetical protein